ncbi:hypothetical protein ACW9UR_01660 [Halovulum sp. GXIMD14794]
MKNVVFIFLYAIIALLITLNILTVTSSSVFNSISSIVEIASKAPSLRDMHRAELDSARKQVSSLQQRNLTLRNQRQKLLLSRQASRVNSLRLSVQAQQTTRALELENNALNYQNRAIRGNVSKAHSRISRILTTSTLRNIATTAGEAIPVAGIAVIVAATTAEVADACIIMQDMSNLEKSVSLDSSEINPKEVCGLKVPTANQLWRGVRTSPARAWESVREYLPGLPDFSGAREYLSFKLSWKDLLETVAPFD